MLLRFELNEKENKVVWSSELTRSLFKNGTNRGLGQMNVVATGNKYLYAIEDLGRGSSGRVWLSSTQSGAVCVLKFANTPDQSKAKDELQKEYKAWCCVYPEFKEHVALELRSGRWALRMPHFSRIPKDKRSDYVEKVRDVLRGKFLPQKLQHTDVTWKNIGVYKPASAEDTNVVVYDLQGVSEAENAGWIDEQLKNLGSA